MSLISQDRMRPAYRTELLTALIKLADYPGAGSLSLNDQSSRSRISVRH